MASITVAHILVLVVVVLVAASWHRRTGSSFNNSDTSLRRLRASNNKLLNHFVTGEIEFPTRITAAPRVDVQRVQGNSVVDEEEERWLMRVRRQDDYVTGEWSDWNVISLLWRHNYSTNNWTDRKLPEERERKGSSFTNRVK